MDISYLVQIFVFFIVCLNSLFLEIIRKPVLQVSWPWELFTKKRVQLKALYDDLSCVIDRRG